MASSSSPGDNNIPPPTATTIPEESQAPSSPKTPTDNAVTSTSPISDPSPKRMRRASTATSLVSDASSRVRAASIKLLKTNPPPGMWAATGSAAAKAPTLGDIRCGSFTRGGWNDQFHKERNGPEEGTRPGITRGKPDIIVKIEQRAGASALRGPNSAIASNSDGLEPFPTLPEEDLFISSDAMDGQNADITKSQKLDYKGNELVQTETAHTDGAEESRPHWEAPPPLPWTTSTVIGLHAFWHWFLTIPGFLITVYGLNIVAWGGMLFLLLCNAAPAMCHPSCNDINSPRRIWIETDSQILNALFCVTGFGLAPWRFRDLYWWAWWRVGRSDEAKSVGIRRLAGVHRGWFRLPGSDALSVSDGGSKDAAKADNPAVPIPADTVPSPPLTGIRAPPTTQWKMDFVVLMNVSNTFLQACLCGFMWGRNRYNRPSWATGFFVALASTVAGLGGIVMFQEGKKVKKVEGAAISREERQARGWPLEDEETGNVGESIVDNGRQEGQETVREKAETDEAQPAGLLGKGKHEFS